MASPKNKTSTALQWFSRALLRWYGQHARDLPWRRTSDPYQIWLSEVILQQTRVDQGMAYWQRFVERYPTVSDLANAPEDDVLKLWQGLGYYSRARNLRTAAQQVMDGHEGQFPSSYEELIQLKGVGEYTAAAIGSISFNLPEPVVDGNVYRVLSRVFGIDIPIDSTQGRKVFRSLAAELLEPKHPGDHNQAVMELGATVCIPKNPLCSACPLEERCIAKATDRITELPIKANRTAVRTRHFNYLHLTTKKGTYLRKRIGKGIWEGLYEFPLIESDADLGNTHFASLLEKTHGSGWVVAGFHGPVKHVLSHQLIRATFWAVSPPTGFAVHADWVLVPRAKMKNYALPRLIDRYLGEGS